MSLRSSKFWNLTHEEVNIMVRASVIERARENLSEVDSSEVVKIVTSLDADNLIKRAYEIEKRADKEAIEYINKQEPWMKKYLLLMYEEEKNQQIRLPKR